MSYHEKTLDKRCLKCFKLILQVSLKSMHIDDFAEECQKCEPGEAIAALNSWNRSAARADEAMDKNWGKQ